MSSAAPTGSFVADSHKSHPPGLYVLFTTEMWERMSYYGMRALLVLYLTDKTRGGFGWSKEDALSVYGWYTGLVYLTPLLGGFLADRLIGQRKAVVIGGTLMMIGHFLLALPGLLAFYAALAFLIAGNGMFKPNISTMVGGLYRPGDARRDAAFTIFYMGINVGATLAGFVCGTLGEKVGWHWGFGSAGVGMLLGLVSFLLFSKKTLGNVGLAPSAPDAPVKQDDQPLTHEEKQRILVITILLFFVVIFWAAFEQAGGLMNLYTDEKVSRSLLGWEVPTTWFQNLNPIFIVLMGPVLSALWTSLARKGKDPSIGVKMALGLLLLSGGFVFMIGAANQSAASGKAAMYWVVSAYFFHTLGELCLSPVGLSMVTKLAPPKLVSLLMGTWFLSNAIANKLAAVIGAKADSLGEFAVFGGIVAVTGVAGLLLLALSGVLKRMMHGADAILQAPAAHAPPAKPSRAAAG